MRALRLFVLAVLVAALLLAATAYGAVHTSA